MDDSRTRQELQALASVYLTGPAPSLQLVGADSDTAHSVEAEVVLLGHLPGFASTWVSQHAAMTAQRGSGNAVLVRFEDGRAHLEHYGETPASPAAAGMDVDDPFDAALHHLERRTGAWMVLADQPHDPAQQIWLRDLDRWTLLCGADDAAVVGAYRLLKTLSAEGLHPRQGVGLVMCGSEESVARAAAEKICKTAGAHLGLEVECASIRPAMEPVNRRDMGSFNGKPLDALSAQLRRFLKSITPVSPSADAPDELSGDELAALREPVDVPEVSHGAEHPKDLTQWLEGVRPIAARCPAHPDVAFGVDRAGVIHLARLDTDASPAHSACHLLAATAWAKQHATLLALTDPMADLDPAQEPVAHLFTDRPRAALALTPTGDPDHPLLRIELFKTVCVGQSETVVHEPLN